MAVLIRVVASKFVFLFGGINLQIGSGINSITILPSLLPNKKLIFWEESRGRKKAGGWWLGKVGYLLELVF